MAAVHEPAADLRVRQLLALEDAGGVAAEAHEEHADRPFATDVVEQRPGLIAGAVAARRLVEGRERRLAHHALAVGADEGHVAFAHRRPRDVLVALRPAVQPALQARRRQLVAVVGQPGHGWPS
jgi:ribosomal protein S5